ncbi:MAG: DedA family protein [Myxococcota bacterium]
MTDEILRYLREHEGALSYLILAAAALIEYVFPPFPGDAVALLGTFLAATAGYHPALVFAALTGGAVLGSYAAFVFGRSIGRDPEGWPRFLRGRRTRRAIEGALERFQRHGAAYLMVNRFIPALRAVFFVAAGMSGMDGRRAMGFGALSAAAWNGLILGLGYAVGENYDLLLTLFEQYTAAVLTGIGLLTVAWLIRAQLRKRPTNPKD